MNKEELRKKIEEAAEAYSKEQFSYAESRTVAPYCNAETFENAFDAGCSFGRELERKRVLEKLRSKEASDYLRDVHNLRDLKTGHYFADWLEARLKEEE